MKFHSNVVGPDPCKGSRLGNSGTASSSIEGIAA